MGLEYKAVRWNRQKRIYDFALVGGVGAFLVLFTVSTKVLFPFVTGEILLMRAFGAAAFILLHVVLCIGPLCRLNPKFLPLLYNRRHAGVTTGLLGLVHATLVVVTYHAGGDTNPILSVFKGSPLTGSIAGVPFQPFGFFALVILLLMAATSHDFWLANLSAPVWKSLHMLVYAAYALLVLHVAFGVLQAEVNPVYVLAVGGGLVVVLGLHIAAAFREVPTDRAPDSAAGDDGFVDACAVADILEKRARIICLSGERVAIFKYDGKVSAVSNVCQHQNGPLGEGKVLDGCITCPWHGYQYLPDTGASPPPFVEKVPTFNVRVRHGRVFVRPKPNPPGTRAEPAPVEAESRSSRLEEALTSASER
ncbi:MAG: ferric reductase-like transmembrane domain-containing protein [Verrucomicrobia bacterium]|nr:ferric reductase-like transmembrane domain-containing protein [Verrucomicrobiota bacterium]